MPINKFIPEIWEDFNVEMNDEYMVIWPIRWYPKDEPKKKPKAKNAWLIKKLFRERKKWLDELKKK